MEVLFVLGGLESRKSTKIDFCNFFVTLSDRSIQFYLNFSGGPGSSLSRLEAPATKRARSGEATSMGQAAGTSSSRHHGKYYIYNLFLATHLSTTLAKIFEFEPFFSQID